MATEFFKQIAEELEKAAVRSGFSKSDVKIVLIALILSLVFLLLFFAWVVSLARKTSLGKTKGKYTYKPIEYKSERDKYYESEYYKTTGTSYHEMLDDDGKQGEYDLYRRLQCFEQGGARFFFNVYVPHKNGEGTSEIDVLMICSKGIIVFENKNYSGWIFAGRKRSYWTQSLAVGWGRYKHSHTERFYNPIMQNRGHLWAIKGYLGYDVPLYSVVVFSDKCTVKYLEMFNGSKQSEYVTYSRLASSVVQYILGHETDRKADEIKINEVYDKLLACTQVDEETKYMHIKDAQSVKKAASYQVGVKLNKS